MTVSGGISGTFIILCCKSPFEYAQSPEVTHCPVGDISPPARRYLCQFGCIRPPEVPRGKVGDILISVVMSSAWMYSAARDCPRVSLRYSAVECYPMSALWYSAAEGRQVSFEGNLLLEVTLCQCGDIPLPEVTCCVWNSSSAGNEPLLVLFIPLSEVA